MLNTLFILITSQDTETYAHNILVHMYINRNGEKYSIFF